MVDWDKCTSWMISVQAGDKCPRWMVGIRWAYTKDATFQIIGWYDWASMMGK